MIKRIGTEMRAKYDKYKDVYKSYEVFIACFVDSWMKHHLAERVFGAEQTNAFLTELKEDVRSMEAILEKTFPKSDRIVFCPFWKRQRWLQLVNTGSWHVILASSSWSCVKTPLIGGDSTEKARKDFPILSKLARDYLVIQATSVEAERLFSVAGYVVAPRRTLLMS